MIPNIGEPTVFTDVAGRRLILSVRPAGEPCAPETGVDPAVVVVTPPDTRPLPMELPVPFPLAKASPEGVTVETPNAPPADPSFTLFVLFYGEYPDMHRRCMAAIGRTTHAREVEVRAFCNALGPQSRSVLDPMLAGRATRVYRAEKNLLKYPAMRLMLHDPAAPISSPWTLWFDDDSMCDVNPVWLANLRATISAAQARDPQAALVGDIRRTDLPHQRYADWLRKASWHRGRPLRGRQASLPTPNGASVHFVSGGCWAVRTDVIAAADIPDARLQHNGGDVCVGEQVYQVGGTMVVWNHNKQQVVTSSVPRRGVNQGALHWV